MIEISIIIPNLNNAPRLEACLQAVLAECAGRSDVEVIVVDNGSRDNSVGVARAYDVRVLEDRSIASPFAVRNLGTKAARGELIVLLDSNCVPLPGWLQYGLELLKNFSVVSGILFFEPIPRRDYIAKFDAIYAVIPTVADEEVRALPGGNLFVRRAAFRRVGLFVAPLRGLGDIEWTNRVYRKGGKLGLAPDARVRYPAKTGWAFAKKMIRLGRGHKEWEIYERGTLLSLTYFLRVGKQFLPPSLDFIRRMYRLGRSENLAIPLLVVCVLCYLTKLLRGWGMIFGTVHPDLYRGIEAEQL